jgi:hypothetical protein
VWLRSHKNIVNVFGVTLASSVLFFLITNFGVWAQGMYARDISGLFQSYVMAIPFFKNTLLGNFFYVSLFFGSYEFVKMLVSKKSLAFLKFGK